MSATDSALLEAFEGLISALTVVLPFTTNETPDYAELIFGEHQTQAMTMHPRDWEAIQTAYLQACSTLTARVALRDSGSDPTGEDPPAAEENPDAA